MEMAAKTKSWLLLSLFLLAAYCMQCVHGKPQVSCFFIFGDSLSDNGNNNNRRTTAKSNYSPYGVDYIQGPTGRFCNGETEADIIARNVGLVDPIPPHANTGGSDILKGVNYASAAAGIRPETGSHRGDIISLEKQIKNHRGIYNRIAERLGGSKKAKRYLSKCLYHIRIGTNDYYGNYFLPEFFSTSREFTSDEYATDLVRRYSGWMRTLHDRYEARKFLIIPLGRIGCTPYSRATYARNGGCAEEVNDAALTFDRKLESEMERLKSNELSPDAKIMFVNTTTRIDTNPGSLGFSVADTSCCPTVLNSTCIENGTTCSNRDEYVFWDGIHRTEAANKITAERANDSIRRLFRS